MHSFPTPLLACFLISVSWCVITDLLVPAPHFRWKPINRVDPCLPTRLQVLLELPGGVTVSLPERLHISQALWEKLASLAEQTHGSHRAGHWRWRGQRHGRHGASQSRGRGQAHHSQVHGSHRACHWRTTGRRGQRGDLRGRWGGWRGDRVQWGVRDAGYYLLLTQAQGLHWQVIVVCVNTGRGRLLILLCARRSFEISPLSSRLILADSSLISVTLTAADAVRLIWCISGSKPVLVRVAICKM